jgi:hypothetical protein
LLQRRRACIGSGGPGFAVCDRGGVILVPHVSDVLHVPGVRQWPGLWRPVVNLLNGAFNTF